MPGALSSIYPLEHDTLSVAFKTRDLEYYGQILLTLQNVQHPILILVSSQKKLVEQRLVETGGLYTFPFLTPREYEFKFIHDLNGNGKWDTGSYLEKLQPEPVEFLPVEIKVRSNWDHDVTMTLKK